MSTIQETHSFGTPFNTMGSEGIDYESPANMALEIAKSASPDSTGKEILQRFREAVSKSAQRRQKDTASPNPHKNSDSLIIYQDSNSESRESNEMNIQNNRVDSSLQSLSVKERVQQSLAHRRAALKEKSMNVVLPSSKYNQKNGGIMKKEKVGTVNKVTSEVKRRDVQPPALEEVVSVDCVSLELNTVDSGTQDSSEEQPVMNTKLDQACGVDDLVEDLKQSQSHSPHLHVSEENNPSIDETTCLSNNHKGITVDEDELLSVSDQCKSVNSESISVQDGEILDSISRTTDSDAYSVSKVSRHREALTPSDNSVQTFEVEDRFSADISQEEFKHIFSPSVSSDFKSLVQQFSPGTSSQASEGGTIIPDISISDSSYGLGSPNDQGSHVTVDYQHNVEVDETTEQPITSFDYLEDVVSPVSKLLVTGLPPSSNGEQNGLSRATASSLIERNKTLMKEVRFADQTCVELSARNSSMLRDMERVKLELQSLSATNKSLHDSVVRSSKVSAKLEEERDLIKLRMEEEKSRFEMQINLLQQNLEEEKKRNVALTEKLDEKSSYLSSVEKKLVSMSSAYKIVHEERNDAKKTVANLTEKIVAIQSKCDPKYNDRDTASSSNLDRLQNKVDQLEKIAEDRLFALDREREINEMLEEQVFSMKQKCADIEERLEENLNASFSSSIGSPSGPSTFSVDDESNEESSTLKLREKLSSAKIECEEYKRELDSIIIQIKKMQRLELTPPSAKMNQRGSPASKKLLCIAKDLAKTCEIVNTAASGRVGLLEQRNYFLTQSISHLQDICSEDSSGCSGNSSLELVESRSLNRTPPKSIMLKATEHGQLSTVSTDSGGLNAEIKRKDEEIMRMKSEIIELQKRYDEAVDELNEVHEIANYAEYNLSKEHEQSRRCEESIEELKSKLHESSNKLQDANLALRTKENEIQALKNQVSGLADQIKSIKAEYHRYNEEYDAQLSTKNEKIRLLSIELDELREKFKSNERELSENHSLLIKEQKHREEAEESLHGHKYVVNSLQKQLHDAAASVKANEKELEELHIELHEAYKSMRLTERRHSEFIQENNSQREKIEQSYSNLEAVVRERDEQICDFKSQLLQANSDLESLQTQNEKLCNEINAAHETISALHNESTEQKKKYFQLLEEHRDVKSIDESQVSEKDALIAKLQRKNESLDRKRARLREYVSSLNAKCSTWEESLHEHQTEAITFRSKYMEAKSQIEQLVKQLEEQRNSDIDLSCEDCKYLRRALVMEIANNSQKDNENVRV